MFNIKKLTPDTLNKKNVVFFIVLSCIFMQSLGMGPAYRFFAYLNLLLVILFGFSQYRKDPTFINRSTLGGLFFIPFAFITIHFLAVENFVFLKEIRHIFIAVFLSLGIWISARINPDYIKRNTFAWLLLLIMSYVLIQAAALWYLNLPYGTTKNPHYLAVYSALMLIASLFCFLKVSKILKFVLAICALCLGIFLLHSSSRPAWIGLIVSAFLLLFFVNKRTKLISASAIMLSLAGLIMTNVGNFATRFGDLLGHLSTEERVVIWRDTWRMQLESSPNEWLLGHGLNSFKTDFMPFSYYHLQNMDYNSPHNFFLELLYISGAIGLVLAVSLYWITYRTLIVSINNQTEYKNIYLLLLAVLTTNLILVSITLPFFSSYNINVIAIVFGVILYLQEINPNPRHKNQTVQ